mmetsp:Transcript_66744/g.105599  ORF Transcript_66744/g.105599 Transcript_66744/m.105599 type:complete len:248 (+) Transcript_66744:181-924(+)
MNTLFSMMRRAISRNLWKQLFAKTVYDDTDASTAKPPPVVSDSPSLSSTNKLEIIRFRATCCGCSCLRILEFALKSFFTKSFSKLVGSEVDALDTPTPNEVSLLGALSIAEAGISQAAPFSTRNNAVETRLSIKSSALSSSVLVVSNSSSESPDGERLNVFTANWPALADVIRLDSFRDAIAVLSTTTSSSSVVKNLICFFSFGILSSGPLSCPLGLSNCKSNAEPLLAIDGYGCGLSEDSRTELEA